MRSAGALGPRLVLASRSPARLATLRAAGLAPEVMLSGVDEEHVPGEDPRTTALRLARVKAGAVADMLEADLSRPAAPLTEPGATLILGCDSVLELDGQALGKPHTQAAARQRWLQMRGRPGVLHTGHAVILLAPPDTPRRVHALASTLVQFAQVSDAEIEAYVATGEPLHVAGAFTLDGLGGAFVERIDGDPHNVVGVSLPLLRTMLLELGIAWPALWDSRPTRREDPGREPPR